MTFCWIVKSYTLRLLKIEAAYFYPEWGKWLDDLERMVREKHHFGWGEQFPVRSNPAQLDLFQPLCEECKV
jgi:hypothetical protein